MRDAGLECEKRERKARGATFRLTPRADTPGLTKRRETPRTVAAFRPWRSWRARALWDLERLKYTPLCSAGQGTSEHLDRLLHLRHRAHSHAHVRVERRKRPPNGDALLDALGLERLH